MQTRFIITIGTLLFGVSLTKAGIREDLEAANRMSNEQWVEKAKLYISVFDELYAGLVNKWKEVGGQLHTNPFFLYWWKQNQFVYKEPYTEGYSGYIEPSQHNPRNCGLHCLRGFLCYPCVQCFDDTGVANDECYWDWVMGTPIMWWAFGIPFLASCANPSAMPIGDDYFTLHVYKPICKEWLYPLLGIKKGNCKKLYDYWMCNFCEPVASLLQKVLKYDFAQFSAEQLDAVLNLYRIYYNADNHFVSKELCPLPFFETLPNAFNNKFANLVINSLGITNETALRYLAIVLALDMEMADESLGYSVHDLSWYSVDMLSVFKILVAQSAIKPIQVHLTIKDSCDVFLARAKQKLDEENAYKQGAATHDGFNYAMRRINE
ncbi:MAG: hypothetical protein ACLRFH_01810 [Opitutales bacterium]